MTKKSQLQASRDWSLRGFSTLWQRDTVTCTPAQTPCPHSRYQVELRRGFFFFFYSRSFRLLSVTCVHSLLRTRRTKALIHMLYINCMLSFISIHPAIIWTSQRCRNTSLFFKGSSIKWHILFWTPWLKVNGCNMCWIEICILLIIYAVKKCVLQVVYFDVRPTHKKEEEFILLNKIMSFYEDHLWFCVMPDFVFFGCRQAILWTHWSRVTWKVSPAHWEGCGECFGSYCFFVCLFFTIV